MRELSTDQQLKWVERVFLRLQAYYGTRFNDLWHGIPAEEVKRVWAEELGGFTGEQISDGLRTCLSEHYPPNLPTFLDYCRARPIQKHRAIDSTISKDEALKHLSEIKKRFNFKTGKGKAAAANDMEDF